MGREADGGHTDQVVAHQASKGVLLMQARVTFCLSLSVPLS